ncbi:MAG TPA: hypothetical protein VHG51_15465 [Longimicrobiaceae bacterium]|nr:hypothetical protein [Longimicrobiaceae bacterium]
MLTALLTLLVIGIVGLVVFSLVLALVGVVFGLAVGAVSLLFKLLPVLLVGYVVVKLIGRGGGSRSHRQLSASDQRWLDS